nr:tRNA (adenosine(37)-N6)-threonylcarbamoyltransferase complex dimerization subunit type 1 TsaB [Alsobacter ponti]
MLAIDTALEACSACVVEAREGHAVEVLAQESLPMTRGHAEALVPLLDRVVGATEGGFERLGRVAVTVGPGSFTGLRVGIASARAVSLARDIPAVGVTTLAAFAAPAIARGGSSIVAVAIDARHGSIYFQAFTAEGRTIASPRIVGLRDAARQLGSGPVRVIGGGAELLAAEARALGLDAQVEDATPAPDIVWVARLGVSASPEQALPKPFYLRPPDAKPQDHVHIPRRAS